LKGLLIRHLEDVVYAFLVGLRTGVACVVRLAGPADFGSGWTIG
jgi:hypothetical protein